LQIVDGISVVVFLNNLSPIAVDSFFSSIDYSFATGARVAVHPPDTLSDMTRAVTVRPGVETTLAVEQIRRKRLAEPWSKCTDKKYLHQETVDDGSPAYLQERRVRYDTAICYDLCVQNMV